MALLRIFYELVAAYFAAAALHWCFFALSALRRRAAKARVDGNAAATGPAPGGHARAASDGVRPARWLVLIPAYKATADVAESVRAVKLQTIAADRVRVVVIGDHAAPGALEACRAAGAETIELNLERSTKVASLKAALAQPHDEDRLLILDSDNLIAPGFLAEMDWWFDRGFDAVQGRRVARNWETAVARLDLLSEALNNVVYRRGRANLGLPCSLIGSAMAFRMDVIEPQLREMDSVGGFDKELELRLISAGRQTAYAEAAVCFDEKLTDRAAFATQKRRWISTQFVYLAESRVRLGAAIRNGAALAYLDKVLQWVFPPRPLLIAGLFLLCALGALLFRESIGALAVWSSFAGLVLLHLVVLAGEGLLAMVPPVVGEAVVLTGRMGMAMLKVRGANRKFLHTPHRESLSIEALALALRREKIRPRGVLESVEMLLPREGDGGGEGRA